MYRSTHRALSLYDHIILEMKIFEIYYVCTGFECTYSTYTYVLKYMTKHVVDFLERGI